MVCADVGVRGDHAGRLPRDIDSRFGMAAKDESVGAFRVRWRITRVGVVAGVRRCADGEADFHGQFHVAGDWLVGAGPVGALCADGHFAVAERIGSVYRLWAIRAHRIFDAHVVRAGVAGDGDRVRAWGATDFWSRCSAVRDCRGGIAADNFRLENAGESESGEVIFW